VKILSIDKLKRRISFGLKPSYFSGNDSATIEASGMENGPLLFNVDREIDDSSDEPDPQSPENDDPSSSDASNDAEDVDEIYITKDLYSHSVPQAIPSRATIPSMELGGFRWTGNSALFNNDEASAASSSSESDDENEGDKKKRRRRKPIQQDFTADMHTKRPESIADFERLLLGSPNSSYLWVQYMSFQLQLSEVGKAREIGQRALETINFREEQEKLNVWIALLNLENVYGTEDSLEATFQDAIRHNDSKTIYLRLASILDQAEKHEVCHFHMYLRFSNQFFFRKPKTYTRRRARNSVKAQKSGLSSLSIISVEQRLKMLGAFYNAVSKA
jgi:rRNA biogenesis protein RRP5